MSSELVRRVNDWFARTARDFPWREEQCTPWGVLVSEVMSQQTQMTRVEPKWREFMTKWPTPADLAAASDAEVIRAWDRLGYPRRAVALRRCAQTIVTEHNGAVPSSRDVLLTLPGIGHYTAAAVASFAFGQVVPVVDTNVRRVLARTLHGQQLAWQPNPRRDESEMRALLPRDSAAAARWNAGAMELGAVICTSRNPACEHCPVAQLCHWRRAGYPKTERQARQVPRFAGSDRQLRGQIMAQLRTNTAGVLERELPKLLNEHRLANPSSLDTVTFTTRVIRLTDALVADGLATRAAGRLHLPE